MANYMRVAEIIFFAIGMVFLAKSVRSESNIHMTVKVIMCMFLPFFALFVTTTAGALMKIEGQAESVWPAIALIGVSIMLAARPNGNRKDKILMAGGLAMAAFGVTVIIYFTCTGIASTMAALASIAGTVSSTCVVTTLIIWVVGTIVFAVAFPKAQNEHPKLKNIALKSLSFPAALALVSLGLAKIVNSHMQMGMQQEQILKEITMLRFGSITAAASIVFVLVAMSVTAVTWRLLKTKGACR